MICNPETPYSELPKLLPAMDAKCLKRTWVIA